MKKKTKGKGPGRKKLWWVLGGFVVVLGLSAAGFFGVRALLRSRTAYSLEPFRPHVREYMEEPAKLTSGESPRIRPKVIIVDVNDREISKIVWRLPPELQAHAPDEVETIVWVKWDEEKVGRYMRGGDALVALGKVTVIDKRRKVIVAEQTFRGEDPPQSTPGFIGQSHRGDRPTEQIVRWLTQLPRS